jgi:hypothetical protein
MSDLGRMLVFVGAIVAIIGVVLIIVGRGHLPIGRLPGDIVYRGKNTVFYLPLATSIILSILLSLVLYVIGRFSR